MGNFFTSLFSSSKPAEATEDKAKNEQKNFDILKYDGVRAQKMGKLVYAIKCFTEALNIQEDFETIELSRFRLYDGERSRESRGRVEPDG